MKRFGTTVLVALSAIALTGCAGGGGNLVIEDTIATPEWVQVESPYNSGIYRTCDEGVVVYLFRGKDMEVSPEASVSCPNDGSELVSPTWTELDSPYNSGIYRACDAGNQIYLFRGEAIQIIWNSEACAR